MNLKDKSLELKPTQTLVIGFLLVILTGTLLLMMPISAKDREWTNFVDALFTSTSAVCVTGLAVVNTLRHWSIFGQVVIMLLIQVGGLGFMTFATLFFILLGRKIGLKERLIIQEALNQNSVAGMVRLTKNVIFGTLLIEGIGTVFLSIKFIPEYGLFGIYMALFHSVSAFCNAGFDIIGDANLSPYVGDILVNVTIMSLIIIGGMGFSVWMDVIKNVRLKIENRYTFKRFFDRLSLHTKIALSMTVSLLLIGFTFFLLVEGFNPDTLGNMPIKEKILGSMFQSVTTRTAGFNTMPMSGMHNSSKLVTIILMFIGGSPGGTAGGIKTVTFGALIFAVYSVIQGKSETEIYHKRISDDIVKKSLAISMISLTVVIVVTLILTLTEKALFIQVLFETVSAFGTVGLSLDLTAQLTVIGKLLITMCMFIGRLGPVTLAVALTVRGNKHKGTIRRPEENIMVG